MSLRTEIAPYLDKYGLVLPHKCKGDYDVSDNGTLFTSEYYLLLALRGELLPEDKIRWEELIRSCMREPGLLNRRPNDSGDTDSIDNQYGVLAAASRINPKVVEDILDYGMNHWGCFNNQDPGAFTLKSFLWRQPQLLAAAMLASNKPLPITVRFLRPFLIVYTALVIATSCMLEFNRVEGQIIYPYFKRLSPSKTDERLLGWLLIQATAPKSLLCRLASTLWFRRLKKDYPVQNGKDAMQQVAATYFHDSHPFERYWNNFDTLR